MAIDALDDNEVNGSLGPGVNAAMRDATVSVIGSVAPMAGIGHNSESGQPSTERLLGEQDAIAGQSGNRHVPGPLAPEHGGTGRPMEDFEKITGGTYAPDPNNQGHLVGPNGERYRPAVPGKKGTRIDIPATKEKPHETLHYPEEEIEVDDDGNTDKKTD